MLNVANWAVFAGISFIAPGWDVALCLGIPKHPYRGQTLTNLSATCVATEHAIITMSALCQHTVRKVPATIKRGTNCALGKKVHSLIRNNQRSLISSFHFLYRCLQTQIWRQRLITLHCVWSWRHNTVAVTASTCVIGMKSHVPWVIPTGTSE